MGASEDTGESRRMHVLEEDQPFSRSRVWGLSRAFYESRGIDAWRQSIVPHFITSNAFIADAYARVVYAYLRDSQPAAESEEPFTLVELGAGSGRFAYLFLKKLAARLARAPGRPIRFRYVMTDLAERNIEFWQEHPPFREWMDRGVLDFARFEVGKDESLALRLSGRTLAAGATCGPMVVLANYFLDSLPLDIFQLVGGTLHEALVTTLSPEAEPDGSDPTLVNRLKLDFQPTPIAAGRYGDPRIDGILEGYTAVLGATPLHFPIGALECCRLLSRIAGGRLLLLTADKGYTRLQELIHFDAAHVVAYGGICPDVNFRVIGQYFQALGGQVLFPPDRPAHLVVAGFLLGEHPEAFPETRQAYADAVEGFGPDDFHILADYVHRQVGVEPEPERISLDQILSLVRLSGHDPCIFQRILPALRQTAPPAPAWQKRQVYNAIERVWELNYQLGDDRLLARDVAGLLFAMGYYQEALLFCRRSVETLGADANTLYNMALCCFHLQQFDAAMTCVQQGLALDPLDEASRALRVDILARLGQE